jgi:hypothetical protein
MVAKVTTLTHKIAIQLHLVAESCTICSSRSRRSVVLKHYLSLCFNRAPRHEGVSGEWMYSSTYSLTSALDGGERPASRSGSFTLRERAPGTHWIWGWVGPRTGWARWWTEKFPAPAGTRTPDHPARSPALYHWASPTPKRYLITRIFGAVVSSDSKAKVRFPAVIFEDFDSPRGSVTMMMMMMMMMMMIIIIIIIIKNAFQHLLRVRGYIQKFPDWVDKDISNNNNKHSFRRNTKGYGSKTH